MRALHKPGAYFDIDCLLNVECTSVENQEHFISVIVFQPAYHSDK